ncbi:nicotinate-nucleotide adenylyltransferase [Bacillaceae bacterium SIJ1]|uniref:nicotinate-nucleotide adenylyltransferase n=1 Tax=Litoribacterium kuwaitense TaxID=1398745 RepID=UPI0013EC9030|nr:nicotinate-nucleotide adenylyltransferase [Litoribacterium kuwaitense]NGP43486.1 nicotinate-nucleotide adenylyltransferase [Litoribacterium kuwaitense]
MKHIGLFGGTFDPPHIGHLMIAQEVQVACQLDEIWFIPARKPPHKQHKETTEGKHRLRMIELATKHNPLFNVNEIEFEHDLSYTVDTVTMLQEKWPEYTFSFIIGADMVEGLAKWKDIDRLISKVQFIVAKRPGYCLRSVYPLKEVDTPEIALSSTWLRKRLGTKKPVKYMLCEEVLSYIKEHDLYVQLKEG